MMKRTLAGIMAITAMISGTVMFPVNASAEQELDVYDDVVDSIASAEQELDIYDDAVDSIDSAEQELDVYDDAVDSIELVNASADFDCDVNNDGYVNSNDVLFALKYLSGVHDVTNVSKLDVNGDHIVNQTDVDCISAKIMGKLSIEEPTNEVYSINSSTTEYYVRCKYDSSKLPHSIAPYSLTLDTVNNGNTPAGSGGSSLPGMSANQNPVDNPGYIVQILQYGKLIGSGIVVDYGIIATSADCIYDNGSFKKGISVVYFDKDGNNAEVNALELHVPEQYTLFQNSSSDYNYGLIYTIDPYDLDYSTCSFGTVVNNSAALNAKIPIDVVGFVNDNESQKSYNLYTSWANISGTLTDNRFAISLTVGSEQMGSAVLTETKDTIGIISYRNLVTNGGTYAIRVDAPIIQFYNNNKNIGGLT